MHGMLGKKIRKLTPTKWSITATDDIISKWLVHEILEMPQINSYETYHFEHLGNLFSIVLFPHRWMYEMIEAWYSGGVLGFGSDHEDARGINHAPAIAGAYHAAKLAVAEHLYERKMQAGSIVLREIRPEYSIPVGVWQVREGVRSALTCRPVVSESLHDSLNVACLHSSISKNQWLRQDEMIVPYPAVIQYICPKIRALGDVLLPVSDSAYILRYLPVSCLPIFLARQEMMNHPYQELPSAPH